MKHLKFINWSRYNIIWAQEDCDNNINKIVVFYFMLKRARGINIEWTRERESNSKCRESFHFMFKYQISNYLQLHFLFLTDLHDNFTLIETRLIAFFRIKPKHCLENWGQETSTCSSCENSLDFMLRTWLITEIKMFIIKGKGSD